jgi:hypothetical protein
LGIEITRNSRSHLSNCFNPQWNRWTYNCRSLA